MLKRKPARRVLTFILAFVMLVSLCPVLGSAAEEAPDPALIPITADTETAAEADDETTEPALFPITAAMDTTAGADFDADPEPGLGDTTSGRNSRSVTGPTDGMELIADFDFSADSLTGGAFSGGGAKATLRGSATITYASAPEGSPEGARAAVFGTNRWMELTKADNSPLLKGLDEFVVSYDVNPTATSGNNVWTFSAQRTIRAHKNNWEHYLGIRELSTSVEVQTFKNSGTRPPLSNIAPAPSGWRHVDIVFAKDMTSIYVNGAIGSSMPTQFSPVEILSPAGGYAYIGYTLWGSGETFSGSIANFKIYKPADPDDAGKSRLPKKLWSSRTA